MAPGGGRRFLMVIGDFSVAGGMEVQLAHLAAGLAELGHHVELVSIRSAPDSAPEMPVGAARVTHLRAPGRRDQLDALRRLTAIARTCDLVHCTGWDASLWGRLAAFLARRPSVMAEHTPGREHQVSLGGAPRAEWIARHNRALDRVTAATVACAEWQVDLLAGEGVDRRRMVVIPNGVPVASVRARARGGVTREDLGIPAAAKVLVHVARFVPQKRHEIALEATAKLRESSGDVRVIFVGEGPEQPRIEAQARALGADWAMFAGRQDNVPAWLALGDAAILPSAGEGLPMVLLEAIAVGTPIVASDVGDVGGLLRRTGTGLAVDAADQEGFVAACRTVLDDADVHARLVDATERSVREVDATTMVARYDALFDAVLARPRRVRRPVAVPVGDSP